jgi:hypothetical protein
VHSDSIGCADCHGQPFGLADCVTCHDSEPAAAPSPTTTHAGVVGGFANDNVQCKRCHGDSQVDLLISHLPFDVGPGTGHHQPVEPDAISCLDCHDQTRADKSWAADFSQSQCLGCHLQPDMDSIHTVNTMVPGYTYDEASCKFCHADGTRNGTAVEHEVIFPIGMGEQHAGIGCGECHTQGSDAPTECAACHATRPNPPSTSHGLVGGFVNSDAECKLCHGESQVDGVADHGRNFGLAFLIFKAPGEEGDVKHQGESCLECHTQNRSDKTWARDFVPFDCLGCHAHRQEEMDGSHSGIANYGYTTAKCMECHEDGGK